jgi:phytoene/squalene synthetase
LPVDHYENFPVASWLVPARLRPPIEAIYLFARGADDIADEGYLPDAQRLEGLDAYLRALDAIERQRNPGPGFERIEQAIREWRLPIALLRDLIDAFKQDVVKKRYATFAELMDYSRRSANPVGRLVLHVFGVRPLFPPGGTASEAVDESVPPGGKRGLTPYSDLICSALQFTNFWQDVGLDWEKGRIYIPQEDLERFAVTEDDIAAGRVTDAWRGLMRFECERARAMLREGAPLGQLLPGRLGLEIRATVAGGAAILDKIDAAGGNVFRYRPKLNKLDWAMILAKAVARTR